MTDCPIFEESSTTFLVVIEEEPHWKQQQRMEAMETFSTAYIVPKAEDRMILRVENDRIYLGVKDYGRMSNAFDWSKILGFNEPERTASLVNSDGL